MKVEICCLQPDFVAHFPWLEALGRMFSHDPAGSFMGGHHFLSGFLEGSQVIFECG